MNYVPYIHCFHFHMILLSIFSPYPNSFVFLSHKLERVGLPEKHGFLTKGDNL